MPEPHILSGDLLTEAAASAATGPDLLATQTIAARDRALAAALARAEAAETEVARLTQALATAQAECFTLQSHILAIETEATAQIAPLQARVGENLLDAVAADRALQRARVTGRDAMLDDLLNALPAQLGDLDHERKARRAAEAQLARVISSTSWRITAPVRWLGRRLGRG